MAADGMGVFSAGPPATGTGTGPPARARPRQYVVSLSTVGGEGVGTPTQTGIRARESGRTQQGEAGLNGEDQGGQGRGPIVGQ